jgi:TP901 family phage tail tape measure protein
MAKGFNLTATINLQGPSNIKQVVNNINKQLGSINANVNLNISAKTVQSITKVNKSLQTLNQTLGTTTQSATTATQAFNNLAAAMASVGNVNLPTNITGPVNNITSSVTSASKALGQTRTEFEDFGRQAGLAVRRFAAFSTVTSVIYSFSNAMSKGIQQYIEFDKQVTRLSQVTNESKASLGSLVGEITRLSTGLGVASEDLATVSVTLAQAGFSAQDTRRALEALAKSALAPSFDNLNQTVEGSIALMRQFGISAVELEGALGSVNAVAAAFAVEASDIIAAIQRTGGVFASASKGVSEGTDALNEFIAVFTSIRATTRESAETIATGLRTIFTRIQRADTVEALKEYGVVLTDLEGKFVGPYEAVRRLSEGLSGLDPRNLKFSQIIEELGGFRQIGKVLPLIQQFATAQDALKVAQEGQGSLATDAAKGQLALAVQIQQVREEFSALVRSIGDGKGFQTLVRLGLDLAGALIKIADATKGVLPLIGIMAAFRGFTAVTQFAGGFGGGLTGGNKKAQGGRIHRFASGGVVPGVGNRDSVPAMLTPGEFVLRKSAVQKYGAGNLVKMNRNSGEITPRKYYSGGVAALQKLSPGQSGNRIRDYLDFYEGTKTNQSKTKQKKPKTKSSKELRGFQLKDNVNSDIQREVITQREIESTLGNDDKFKKYINSRASKDKQRQFSAAQGIAFEKFLFTRILDKKQYKKAPTNNYPLDFIPKISGLPPVESKFTYEQVPDAFILNKRLRYNLLRRNKEQLSPLTRKEQPDNIQLGPTIVYEMEAGLKSKIFSPRADADESKIKRRKEIANKRLLKLDELGLKRNTGGYVQRFEEGGVAQRRVGYIDYDVIANEANKAVVEKGMEETGSDGPRIYSDYLTKLAVNARKSANIQKLRAIYGVAGSGKTTLARGQGTDRAKLRQTERFPILSPEDIQKATEILILTSSVSQAKMDDFFGDVDRAYTLSSTTDAERQGVRSRKESRDITGIGLENRKPGTTMGVSTDSAVGEALLSDKLGAKSTVLGRSDSGRLRRKKGNELVEIIKKKIGLTWGGFAPTTAGHESLLDAAAAMGIPPEDFIALVGANEAVDESSYRTAIFDQDSRVLLAKAGFGAKGATVLPKPRDFEVPQGFDLTQQGSDRRQVLIPGQGSTVFVADKTEKQIEKYKEAGYKVKTTERTGGISGTGVRDLMIAGDMTKLQSVLSPGVYDLISNNIGRIQNRSKILPSLIKQAQEESKGQIAQVDQQIEALGIKRIDSEKVESDPEYAAKVEVLKELRAKKQKIKSAAGFTPYKLLDALAEKDPQNYALDFSAPSTMTNVPEMRVMGQGLKAPEVPISADRVAQLAQEKNKSIQEVILEQLGGLGGPAGVKKILGIGSGDRTLSSLLQAGNIKSGKGLEQAADYVNKALATKGIRDAAEAKRLEDYQAKALHFGIAGLLPMDYSKEFEWDIGGTDVYATARGFGSTYLEEAKQMQKESSELAQRFAENVQNKNIFGGGEKLAFDFDKTLVDGADILDAKGNPDIPKYSDRNAVKAALQNARPTRLAIKLKSLVDEDQQDPPFIKKTRILTARPQSTADLLAQSLQSFGLPYAVTDITGVSGGVSSNIPALKAANLQKEEKLIDDSLDNIMAVRKAGKKGFQYTEPKPTTSELDEKMGQGNIEGAIVEKALAVLGAPVRPDAKQNRAIDYPDGLGSAAQFFPGIDPGIPTEVKRTIDGSSLEKVREEIGRYITGGAQAVKLARGGAVQSFMAGGVATKTRKTKEPFGTGETEFPTRISKKYAEEQHSASENLRAKLAWEKNPKDERIMVDDQKVQEAYQQPFDRDRFAASFKEKISRDSLFQRMSDFSKFVGLPQEDLAAALPLQLDFGASNRGGGLGMYAAAQFEKGATGIRPYEGYDISKSGYGEKQKQEAYGLEKLITAKEKEIAKIVKTPIRTYDDGSFSFDREAYSKANDELAELKNKSFKLKDLKRDAEKAALAEQAATSSATGRGTISFASSMGYSSDTKNSTLYHEMTHQLFEGLRKKSADSFSKYRDRVSSLFSGDNDDLADAFDSLTAGGGYTSADVVYGRSYKSNNLSQILSSYYRQNLDFSRSVGTIPQDTTKNLASLSTQSTAAKRAREYRPINPQVNEALLQAGDKFGMTQEKINRMEDNGKEEFLTTLMEKAPQLDQNLQGILDSTLTELLSGAGIQRQKYAAGRRVDYEAGVGASPFGDSLSKRLSRSVYDLQKGTGLSDAEFNEIKKTADTYGYNEEEFKEYLAKRVQEKKNKKGLTTNPSALAQQLMPQAKTLRPELRALADSLKDTRNDIGYRPSALENIAQARTDIKNARGFAVGGVAEPEQKKEKQYGKISITEDSGMISAGYLKSGTENSRQGHATASKLRDNLYYVGLSSATKGYGPRLYDVLMEAVTEKGAMLTSDRSSVSGDARKVWEYYFNNRGDVKKTQLEPKDWTQNDALLDPKLYGKKETWPPATDPAWILQSGYSKSPSLIKGPDVVRPSTKPDSRAMALSYFSSRAPAFADGGTVPALVSNGEAYVPPKVAKRIGYGTLSRMNQADRNGMSRFSDGGISVFKGPGTGTSDSIPANLPVGSFIIREKATKALGFSNGGLAGARVQRFAFGGGPRGPAPRPDTISLDTIGATGEAVAALQNVAAALTALGVSSSKSAQLLNRGYQATAAEATKAYEADLLMAKAAGASADVLYDLETALDKTKKQAEAEVNIRTELGDIDGGDLQNILSDVEDRIRSLTETARAGAQSRGLSDEEAEKEVREGSASRRAQAFEEAASNRGTDLGALGATGNDLERVINNLTRDAKTLEQMNRQYAANRRVVLEQEAAAARAAGTLALTTQEIEQTIKDEIQARKNAIQEVADSNQSRGPNDREKMDRQNSMLLSFGVMTVGNIIANNISTKSDMASAGLSGAIRGGTEAFSMTNQVKNELDNFASMLISSGGTAAQFGNLLSTGLKFAPAIQAIAVLGQAAIDAHNAMRQFTIDLEKSKIERALDGIADKFEKLNKDLNQLNLRDEIKTNLIDASRSADRLRSATIDTATVGWVNAIDVLVTSFEDAGDGRLKRQSALRSQVLEQDGILEYLKINSGDTDAYNRASSKFAGQQATESSASFKPIADGINQLIQARARAGETSSSITSAPEFEDFAKSLVYADVALNKQIRQIELSTEYTEAEKKARIEEIISIEGANKIRTQAAIGQREAEQKSISLLTSVYTRSLKRMFTNMEQAINAAAFSLKQMSDSVDLATAAITGQAKVGNIDLETSNVIQNPRAYSDGRVASAQAAAGSLFGSKGPEMSKLMNLGETVESTVMSTINKTLENKGVDASNESIASAVDQSVRVELKNLGLPPELSDKLAKEVGSTLVDLRSSGEDKVDFAKLSERLGSLNSVIDTAKDAQQATIKALENYQNVLNQYANNINKIIDLESSSRERSRKAIQISSDSNLELAKSLGRTIRVSDAFAKRDASVSRQTGGLTDPNDIFQKILKLNTDRQVQQSSAKQAAEKGPSGIQDFVKFNNELSSTNIALRENRAALEEMANNTDKASAAMGAMQEAQQKAAGRLGFLEKVVTSTPEELESLNQSLYRLQRNMNGQQNTIQNSIGAQKAYRTSLEQGASAAEAMRAAQTAFSNERKETLGTLQEILPFLGDSQQAGNVKANVLESMLQESGMGVSPLFQQVLNTLRNPEQDPATAAAMQYYQQATIDQANATRLLGELDTNLAQDIARLNSKLVVDGLVAATLNFQNKELQDIAKNVNQIVSIMNRPAGGAPAGGAGAPPAVGIATGGLVYASAGQLINFQPQGTDTVPAMLTPGEFVVNRKSTQANLPLLRSINSNKYNSGGSVGYYAGGGLITNWGKPDTMKNFDQISKKEIITGADDNKQLIEKGYLKYTKLPSVYTLNFPTNSPALPMGNTDPYSLSNISLSGATVVEGISPGLEYDGKAGYNINYDPAAQNEFKNPTVIKNESTLYLGSNRFKTSKVSKLEEDELKHKLRDMNIRETSITHFNPDSFSDGKVPQTSDFPPVTRTSLSPNLRTGKSPGISTKGRTPSILPVEKSTPIYKPFQYNRPFADPQGHMNTMAAAVDKLTFPVGPLSNNYDPNKFFLRGAGYYGRYDKPKEDIIRGDAIKEQVTTNKENAQIYKDTLEFMAGIDVYEKSGAGVALQDKLRSLFDNQVSSITLDKTDLVPFDELKDATTAIIGQPSLETSFAKASETPRGVDNKIKFGLVGAPPIGVPADRFLSKPFTITDDIPVSKSYPFMINGSMDDLGTDFKDKAKEEQAKLKGKVSSTYINDNLKLTLPFDINGSKPVIDVPISYEKYTGELYDKATSKFSGKPFTTLLPTRTDTTLFQKLDTSTHRLFTPKEYTEADILGRSSLNDPVIQTQLLDLVKMITNNNPTKDAQAAKVSAGLELLFNHPANSYVKYPNVKGDGGADVFSGTSDLDTKVNIGEFVLKKLEEFRGQVASGASKVAQVPGLKKGAVFSDADLPVATSALIRGAMGLFGNLRLPGFPSGWLVKSGAANALRAAISGNPSGAAGHMSGIFNQAGAFISQLQNRATTVPAYNALDNASTMINGAANAFASLAGGDTGLLKQFYEQKIQIAEVFRSFGTAAKFGKVSGLKLSPDWQNILGNQLTGTKIKTVGRNGSLTETDLAGAIPENANVNDLIKVLFNPYNEFPNKSTRADLIQKFGNDLFNLRGPNRMPYFDPKTLSWIGDGLIRLKKWYGGDGNWLGQDYFFDTAAEPDNVARMSNFLASLTTDGQQYYKSAQEAQVLFGLANSFGPLPGVEWFTARGAVLPQNRATGGIIYAQNGGGPFVNFAPKGTDTVPAMLTPGEFVINRSATQKNLPLLKAINSNNYSSGGMINYLADGGTAKDKTWIGSDNLAVSALGWLGGMGEATGRAAYGAANVVSGAIISGAGRAYQGGAYLAGSESQQAAGAAFAQVGEQAVAQGAYSAVELGQAVVGQGPIQTGEQTALQIGDAARVESVRQGMGDTAAAITEGAQTVGFVASQLAQMGASLGMGTGSSVAGAFARATSVVDRLSDLGTLAPVLSKIPGMRTLGGGAQAAAAGVAKILHSAGEAMPSFKRFLVDPTAKFLTEAGSVADNLDVIWGAATNPTKAKALEEALENSGGSWSKAMETIKPPTPSATAASKAATSSTPTPTTKAADDVTDATIKLPKAQRLLVEDQVNKFRQFAQEARAQEITQHIKWAEGEANSIVSKMPTTASDDLRKIGFDLDMGPPPAAIRNDDLIGDIINKQMDNDNVWQSSRAQALQDAEKALKNKEAIDAFRKGVDDPNIRFENRTWRDWSSNKVRSILEKLPKSKKGRLALGAGLAAGLAGLAWWMMPKNQPEGKKAEQRTDLAPTEDLAPGEPSAVAGAPGAPPKVPSSPTANAAANAAATKPRSIPNYYDELTYKEYVSRELAAGNPPPAPDKKLFTTVAFYGKDKDGSFRQTAYDRRATNIPQQAGDDKDPKSKTPFGGRNKESQLHTRTAAFVGEPTGQFGVNQDTKQGNAKIKESMFPSQLEEAYGAEPMEGEESADAEKRAQKQASVKITGRKGIESQYKSAYSFYRNRLGEYTYTNSVAYKSKDRFAQGKMKFTTDRVGSKNHLSTGGIVYASTGALIPYAPKGTDTVPAMLTPGEFVVNARATAQNLPLLKSINNGGVQGLSKGGVAYLSEGGISHKPINPLTGNRTAKTDNDFDKKYRINSGIYDYLTLETTMPDWLVSLNNLSFDDNSMRFFSDASFYKTLTRIREATDLRQLQDLSYDFVKGFKYRDYNKDNRLSGLDFTTHLSKTDGILGLIDPDVGGDFQPKDLVKWNTTKAKLRAKGNAARVIRNLTPDLENLRDILSDQKPAGENNNPEFKARNHYESPAALIRFVVSQWKKDRILNDITNFDLDNINVSTVVKDILARKKTPDTENLVDWLENNVQTVSEKVASLVPVPNASEDWDAAKAERHKVILDLIKNGPEAFMIGMRGETKEGKGKSLIYSLLAQSARIQGINNLIKARSLFSGSDTPIRKDGDMARIDSSLVYADQTRTPENFQERENNVSRLGQVKTLTPADDSVLPGSGPNGEETSAERTERENRVRMADRNGRSAIRGLDLWDTNKDGKISFEETGWKDHPKSPQGLLDWLASFTGVPNMVAEDLGIDMRPWTQKRIFDEKFDKNKSGFIEPEEFANFVGKPFSFLDLETDREAKELGEELGAIKDPRGAQKLAYDKIDRATISSVKPLFKQDFQKLYPDSFTTASEYLDQNIVSPRMEELKLISEPTKKRLILSQLVSNQNNRDWGLSTKVEEELGKFNVKIKQDAVLFPEVVNKAYTKGLYFPQDLLHNTDINYEKTLQKSGIPENIFETIWKDYRPFSKFDDPNRNVSFNKKYELDNEWGGTARELNAKEIAEEKQRAEEAAELNQKAKNKRAAKNDLTKKILREELFVKDIYFSKIFPEQYPRKDYYDMPSPALGRHIDTYNAATNAGLAKPTEDQEQDYKDRLKDISKDPIYASNGMLVPYQPRGTDTVPAMLTPGEFVVNRAATQANLPLLQSINRSSGGKVQYRADGGSIAQDSVGVGSYDNRANSLLLAELNTQKIKEDVSRTRVLSESSAESLDNLSNQNALGMSTNGSPNGLNEALKPLQTNNTKSTNSLKSEILTSRREAQKNAELTNLALLLTPSLTAEALKPTLSDMMSNRRYYSRGGPVYASEGTLVNYQPRGTDTVPAMLTPGEFVVNRASTAKNLPLLRSINSGSYSSGGVVNYLQDGGLPNKPYYGPLTKSDSQKAQRNKKLDQQIQDQEAEAFRKLGIPYSDTTTTEDIMEALKKQRDYPKNLNKYTNKFNTDSQLGLNPQRFPRISEAAKRLREQPEQPEQPAADPFAPIDYGPGPAIMVNGKRVQSKANGGIVYAANGGLIPLLKNKNVRRMENKAQDADRRNSWVGVRADGKLMDKYGMPIDNPMDIRSSDVMSVNARSEKEALQEMRKNFDFEEASGERIQRASVFFRKQKLNLDTNDNPKSDADIVLDELIFQIGTDYKRFLEDSYTKPGSVVDKAKEIVNKMNGAGGAIPPGVVPNANLPLPNGQQLNAQQLADMTQLVRAKQESDRIWTRVNYLTQVKQNTKAAIDILDNDQANNQNRETFDETTRDGTRVREPKNKENIGISGPVKQGTQVLTAQNTWATDELDYIKAVYDEIMASSTPQQRANLASIPRPQPVLYDETVAIPAKFNRGGIVYASEGMLVNYQPRGTDTVPAMLTPGEFVVNARSAKKNLPLLHSINSNNYATGGKVAYLADGTKETPTERSSRLIKERRESVARAVEAQKRALRDSREAEMQSRRDSVAASKTQGISYQKARQQQSGLAPESLGNASPQPQGISQISPQTQQRVGMAAQAAFDPKNSGDMNKQLVIFGTLLTGVNQVITQFGAVMQQLVAGAGQAGGGVNNSGQGTPSTDGISQFTTSLNNFVNQLQKLNIPEQINISLTQTKPIDVNINGADALQQLLGGPLGEMIKNQVKAALNQRDINDEKPAS